MGELIKKINWHNIDDAAQFESWLSEQAKQGLLFRKTKGIYIYFEQTRSYDMEYRIVRSKYNLTEEQKMRYEQLGWKIVYCTKNSYILAGLKEENPSELYFGEKEEQDFKRVSKSLLWLWIGLIAFWIFLVADMLCMSRSGFQLNWMRLFEGKIEILNPFVFIILGLTTAVVPYSKQQKYIKAAKEKGCEAHHVPWKGTVIRRIIMGVILILIFIMMLINLFFFLPKDNLSEREAKEKYPFIEWKTSESNKLTDDYNSYVNEIASCLLKAECFLEQSYTMKEEEQQIRQEYYELRFNWCKDRFMKSVLEENTDTANGELVVEPEQLSSDTLDTVYYVPVKGQPKAHRMIASNGKKILFVRYEGDFSKEQILEKMEQELK